MHKPDRGYSWVIALCCSYMHFALFGLFRSSGVIYVALVETYHVPREEASWPMSICTGVFQLVGPAAGVLTRYISLRQTALLGSAIATVGIAACYFAHSVLWMNVFLGVVHGIGFGIVTTIIPVILNQHFVKYRATAIGLAFAGGTLSSMVFPIVMEWLLYNYNLRDSFLILSGVVMNMLVASSLLREPPWLAERDPKSTPKSNTRTNSRDSSEANDSGVSVCGDIKTAGPPAVYSVIENDYDEEEAIEDNVDTSVSFLEDKDLNHTLALDDTIRSNDSVLFCGSNAKTPCSVETECENRNQQLLNETDHVVRNQLLNETDYSVRKPDLLNKTDYDVQKTDLTKKVDYDVQKPDILVETDHVIRNLLLNKTDYGVQKTDLTKKTDYDVQKPLMDGEKTFITPANKRKDDPEYDNSLSHSVVSILREPMFYIITFTMAAYFLAAHSFFMVIVDFAKDKGIPESQGVYIISVFSATDMIGRAGLGWVTDRNFVTRRTMMTIDLTLMGIVLNIYPFMSSLTGLLVVAAFNGIAIGSSITVFFVVLAEYFGFERLTLVIGMTSFVNGLLSFLRPGIIGMFRDVIGSYDWMFHFTGGLVLIWASVWLIGIGFKKPPRPIVIQDKKA